MSTVRLFPATNGPATATALTGDLVAGIGFQVQPGDCWLEGYWWWCCNTGQDTGPVTCALWQYAGSAGAGDVVAASEVTSGNLTAGTWNWIPLPVPIQLSPGAGYVAAIGAVYASGVPYTANEFASGDPFQAGITSGPNGPLVAWGDSNTFAAAGQGLFTQAGASAFTNFPDQLAAAAGNYWVDVAISNGAPEPYGGTFRLWPNMPYAQGYVLDTATNFTLGTEFRLTEEATPERIWFYSPSGATQLPTGAGIYEVLTQALMTGSHVTSPTWSGAAGSGWVSCSLGGSGCVLPPGDYKVCVVNGAATPTAWNATTYPYWDSSGPGANGIKCGPLYAPATATAASPGQSTYNVGTALTYPATYSAGSGTQCYWVDVEVRPTRSDKGHYRAFGQIEGPATATAYTGGYVAGTWFTVTDGCWFEGFWWWCCGSGQATTAVPTQLWQLTGVGTAVKVPGTNTTSAPLIAGQWNWIPLATPVALSPGIEYMAAIGMQNSFPDTGGWYAAGGPGAHGTINGPLLIYSSVFNERQGGFAGGNANFSTASGDPTAACPFSNNAGFNSWLDVQVTDQVPPGYAGTYRIWPTCTPAMNSVDSTTSKDNTSNFVLSQEFWLTQQATVDNIWWFSYDNVNGNGATTQLPTSVDIWAVTGDGTTGTNVYSATPTWSGAAGSGWMSTPVSGVTLPAGKYKVSVYNDAATPVSWSTARYAFWKDRTIGNTTQWGVCTKGVRRGPLTIPAQDDASLAYSFGAAGSTGTHVAGDLKEPCTCSFQIGPGNANPGDIYPNIVVGQNSASPGPVFESFWLDIEVSV